jgi:hypothetical protein
MSELRLREFGARAEELLPLPDFAGLDRRGRVRRQRRLGVAAALVASVLAVVGLMAMREDPAETVEPAHKLDHARIYPGAQMQTLDSGTYVLLPSFIPGHPQARVTLPTGWNSWVGPNRFNGHAPGRDNGEALDHATWYVGVVVIEPESVASGWCNDDQRSDVTTPKMLSRAVSRIPGYRITREPETTAMFGYQATHFALRSTAEFRRSCPDGPGLFYAAERGLLGSFTEPMDVWVVDVEGIPVLVQATWSARTPTAVRQQLTRVVDSIEFFMPV